MNDSIKFINSKTLSEFFFFELTITGQLFIFKSWNFEKGKKITEGVQTFKLTPLTKKKWKELKLPVMAWKIKKKGSDFILFINLHAVNCQ